MVLLQQSITTPACSILSPSREKSDHHQTLKPLGCNFHITSHPIPKVSTKHLLSLDGEFAGGEMCCSLLLLLGDSAGVLLAQLSADGTGLLLAEIEG
jgi:hypothetical protein